MARRDRLTVADMQGAWAIIPTPAKPDASDWRATDTVNLDETARIVEALIAEGVDGILSLGTLGECAALSWDEKRAFMACVHETARGRVPVFGGTTCLSTRETIAQTAQARDIGLEGTMVGPSMWNKPDIGTAVQFFRDLAEAVPEMAICVYANPFVFKFDYPTPFWAQVADIPQLVAAKTASHASTVRDVAAVKGNIRLMPLDSEYYGAAKLEPDQCTAFWSSGVCCGPKPALVLRDLVREAVNTGDWSKAHALAGRIGQANLPVIAYGDFNQFQMHNVALEKGRMKASGWMDPGPHRPPYHIVPDQIAQFAETAGKAWAALDAELRAEA